MKSDWHRYNLKRRVAQLPAVDEGTFTSKIAALSLSENNASPDPADKLTKKEQRRREREALQTRRCELLAARQAIQSKMNEHTDHKNSQSVDEEAYKESVVSSDEGNADNSLTVQDNDLILQKLANRVEIPVTTCLFCPDQKQVSFSSVEENISHMFKSHGLYVPEFKFLIDKEGLIGYLGEKIGLGNICLVCNYQGRDVSSVREHMHAKRHMKIPYESEVEKLEISEFYDFSSTYASTEVVEVDLSAENEWEDISENESDEILEDSGEHILDTGTELVLPSGAVIGHRSLARYYRQSFAPEKILSEGQGTVVAAETRHFINTRSKQELASQKRAWGRERKREDVNDRRAAKFINNQPHFRDPLLQ